MTANYDMLAGVYDRAGLGQFAEVMTPRMLNFAQQNEWVGRRIIELGCGTGISTAFFSKQGYSVTGIDRSVHMLERTRQRLEAQSLSANLVEGDITELSGMGPFDLAIAVDVLNDLDNVREIETVFGMVHDVLAPQRMFMFDLRTIEGLVRDGMEGDQYVYKDSDLAVFSESRFDFEHQTLTTIYDVFEKVDGWTRLEGQREQRAFPIQAVATLLRRQKFDVIAVLDTQLKPFDLSRSGVPRALFFARNM